MIDSSAFNNAISYLQRNKPDSVQYFIGLVDFFEKYIPVDINVIQAAKKLVAISRYLYIDNNILLTAIKRNELVIFVNLLYQLLDVHYWSSTVLLSSYSLLTFPLYTIEKKLLSLVKNSFYNLKKGEAILRFCLNKKDHLPTLFFLELFDHIGRNAHGFILDFLEIIKNKIKDISWELFVKWCNRGIDLITSNRIESAVSFFKLESKESRIMLNLNYTVLADIRQILNIYSSSIAGKAMNILSFEFSSFALKATYTDGKTIFLPPSINFFEDESMNERIYTALAAHQAAAVTMGTYKFDFTAIDYLAELRERYGTVLPQIMDNVSRQYQQKAESIRQQATGEIEVTFPSKRKLLVIETDHEKFFYSFPTPDFARELFNLIENVRIEYHLSCKYKGLDEDFKLLNQYLWDIRPSPVASAEREGQFFIALESLIQYSLSGRLKNPEAVKGIEECLKQITDEFKKIYSENSTVMDTSKICFNIYNIFYDNFPIVAFTAKNDISESFSDLNKPEIAPEIILESSPELLKEEEKPLDSEPEVQEDTDDKAIDLGSFSHKDKKVEELRRALLSGALQIYRYPEYDFTKGSYKTGYCTLFETELESLTDDYYSRVLKNRQQIFKRIKKRFLMLQPEEVEMSRRWLCGDEIHLGDAVDYAIDLLRGASADEKIYFQKIRNVRDIAVAILVDASSSTEQLVNNQPIIDIEKAALSLLASALNLIGDTFGIFTFFSLGQNNVFFNILKDFNESWNSMTQGRIASVNAFASNRDGCAIRHVAARLDELPHKTKLIILLSDGIPADVNYGSESSADTSEYAIEDTRRAIIEARKRGIVPYCITIDKAARGYIPHLYGDYNYTILDDVSLLPERLSKLYLKLTR